jgi:O-antigen/teichoic acid export membrane protein
MSVGRMTAISYLGNTATGYYGVGASIAMLFALVPNMIGRVFYPRVNAQIGAKAELHELRHSVVTPTSAITLLLPLAQALIFFALPPIYNGFLPKYRDGVACAQILILGAFFVSMIRNGANYLIAADMQSRLLKYVLVSVIANAAASIGFAKTGYGINGIAVATSLASGVLAFLIWRRVFIELQYDSRTQFSLFCNFYLPFVGTLMAIAVVQFGIGVHDHGSIWFTVVRMVITLGICAAIVALFRGTRERTRELWSQTRSALESWFGSPVAK